MKSLVRIAVSCVLLMGLFSSCNPSRDTSGQVENRPLSSMSLSYAEGFSVEYMPTYKKVTVFHPWNKGEVLDVYYLTDSSGIATPQPRKTMVIPLQKVALTSVTQNEFMDLLGETATIKGVCAPEIVYNPRVKHLYEEGRIVDLGDNFRPNEEQILLLQPDMYMLSFYGEKEAYVDRLTAGGVKVVYNNEWIEGSALARAEWIKFVAAFFNKEAEADSIFRQIEENYQKAMRIAKRPDRKKVLVGGNFKGTWYVPGGRSYMGKLLQDAGLDYFYAADSSTGSLPLNFETVLQNFRQADLWVNAPAKNRQEFYALDERYRLFDADAEGEVYGFYRRCTPGGANDFWESGVVHPDRVLSDIIWAAYPELLPDYQPFYILKLE